MITRTITGIVLFLVLMLGLALGGLFFSALWVLSLLVAIYEQYRVFKFAGHNVVAWPSFVCLVSSVPVFVLSKEANSLFVLLGLIFVTFVLLTATVVFRKEPNLNDLMISILPVFTTVLPGLCMLEMLKIESSGYQKLLLALTFLVPVIGDTGAYFIGTKFGKKKLAPVVSPKKTVEGSLAGILFSVLCSVLVTSVANVFLVHIPLLHSIILGLLAGLVGQVGDLFASLIKRYCQAKDYGNIFPGHGGMMDRLDSILFVSVLMYLYYLFYIAK